MLIFLLLSSAGAWRYLQMSTPKYQATATIKIQDKSGISDTKLFKDFDVFNQNNKIQTEVEVLKSRYLFEKALQKLTDDYSAKIDKHFAAKEKELLTV